MELATEALADVLVDYNVPAGRVVAEFKETVAAYVEMEAGDIHRNLARHVDRLEREGRLGRRDDA